MTGSQHSDAGEGVSGEHPSTSQQTMNNDDTSDSNNNNTSDSNNNDISDTGDSTSGQAVTDTDSD